jgi:DNA invertase Pin-like site-specific DNA recombinase
MDVGYCRVSTADQDLKLQIAALEKAGCAPIYREQKSGVAKHLPVRHEVLRTLKAGDTLTVWKLDRLGRSLSELDAIVNDLKARGVAFRSLTESIDTSSPQGRLFFILLAAFAEFERAIIRERSLAGKQQRALEGKHPGGQRMYGLALDRVTEVPHEADRLREAAKLVLNGATLAGIVDRWNHDHVPTRTGTGRWNESTLRRMLTNERIIPIIGEDTFQRLQGLFRRPDRQKLGPPPVHLLSGILRCAKCSQPMYRGVSGRSGPDPGRPVYRCRGAGDGGRFAGCGEVSVTMAGADEWMAEAFIAFACGPRFRETLEQRRAALLADDATPQAVDAWRVEMGELEAVLGTRFGVKDHERRYQELRRLVDRATEQLMARPELQELADLPESEEQLRSRWNGWDVERRRHYLKAVLEAIHVKPAVKGYRRAFDGNRLDPDWKF